MPDYQIATAGAAQPTMGVHRLPISVRVARSAVGRRLGWYLRLHLLCLILYSFFGKGFAYLGTRFFYVSEALLILGLVAMVAARNLPLLFRTSIGVMMLPFLLWESICAFPYIDVYGINVARDAMVWGYAAFAWIMAALVVSSSNRIDLLLNRYRRFVPWFLTIGPLAMVISVFFAERLPKWPGTEVAIIAVKFDEYEAHLAGIAASVIVGLNPASWWSMVLIGLDFLIGAPNRGGLVGFALAFVVASALARRLRALTLPAILLVALSIAAALDIHVAVPGVPREFSVSQLFDDFDSTVSTDADAGNLQNTRDWRLEWWGKIWDYTVLGPYFWAGKGYGINIAADDGYEAIDGPLRSPHNSHLTILARSGVPGFLLWIALQLTWLATMLTSFLQARRSGMTRWAALFAWVICYWVALMTAASFDVFLENPMAGIPLWTIFGLGWGSHIIFSRCRESNLKPVLSR